MFYILGLLLIIGLILGGFSGSLPFDLNASNILGVVSEAFNNFKNKTYDFIFPESENEIMIDNLNSNYDLLDRFFSKSSDTILKSKDIPENQKNEFKQAIKAFNETREQIKTLSAEAVKNNPGVLETIVKKTLGLEEKPREASAGDPDPTYIPPQCRLECNGN